MTPERSFVPEVMAMNREPYMRSLQDKEVTFIVTFRLKSVERVGADLRDSLGTGYSDLRKQCYCDQIVVNQGTIPLDELYFELKPCASNLGAVNHDALITGLPQSQADNSSCFALAMSSTSVIPMRQSMMPQG